MGRQFLLLTVALAIGLALSGRDDDPKGGDAVIAEPEKYDPDALSGQVLPFQVVSAIRNFGFGKDNLMAQISISVEGGGPSDWMATGIYVAEHSIVNGAKRSEVEVITPNPWADWPPMHAKWLARVDCDPDAAIPGGWNWFIESASTAGTIADIDFDIIVDDQIGILSDKVGNPDNLGDRAVAAARKIIIKKYNLPKNWHDRDLDLGLTGRVYARTSLRISSAEGGKNSLTQLLTCLRRDDGAVLKGCRRLRPAPSPG